MWGVWLDLSCVHVYRPPLQSVQQAVAAGPRRTAQPAGQQRPASQPVSVFCNFLFLLLPHFLCIYVCVCPALDPDFTAISRASALVPLGESLTARAFPPPRTGGTSSNSVCGGVRMWVTIGHRTPWHSASLLLKSTTTDAGLLTV